MTIEPKDCPELWTVEEVKQWAERTFPFGTALATALVDNDVDGAILLEHITNESLKQDLGIKSLGQRIKVLQAISDLNAKQGQHGREFDRRQSLPSFSQELFLTPSTQNYQSRMAYTMEAPRIKRSEFSLSRFPDNLILQSPHQTREFAIQSTPFGLSLRSIEGTPKSIISRFRADKTISIETPPPTPSTPTIRRPLNDDASFNVPLLSEEPSLEDMFSFPGPHAGPESTGEPKAGFTIPQLSKKRTLMEDDNIPNSPTIRPVKRRKLLSFFGAKELRAAKVMFPLENDANNDTDPEEFSLIASPTPVGERMYVQRLMRKLFFNPDQTSFQRGQSTMRTVWKLHDVSLIKKHEQYQALVFDENLTTGDVKVFQGVVDVLGIPGESTKSKEENTMNPFEGEAQQDDWSYLEKWNHISDDTLLPAFGESDSEDEHDESILREMEEEQRAAEGEPLPVANPLSLDIVREIIEAEIIEIGHRWGEKSLPKLDAKAYRIWNKQHRQRTKKLAASNYEKSLYEVRARTGKLKEEYEGMEWRSEEELKKMCLGLEESVNMACELQWRIDLMRGPAPKKPVKSKKKEVVDSDAAEDILVDGETVETEMEEVNDGEDVDDGYMDVEEGDMDGFIVGDDEVDCQMPDCELEFGEVEDDDDELASKEETEKEKDPELLDDDSEQPSPPRKRRKPKIVENEDEDEDVDDQIVKADVNAAADTQQKPATDTDQPASPAQQVAESMGSIQKKLGPDLESSSLPTPPQEPENLLPVKFAPSTNKRQSSESAEVDLSGYDSDIFHAFGDVEIAEFCQCTEQSARVARDYLRKADGNPARAIAFYYEDVEKGRFVETVSPSRPPKKDKGKARAIVLDEDDDIHIIKPEPSTSSSQASFGVFNFRGRKLATIKKLLASLQPENLHQTIIEIAEMVLEHNIDLATQFLIGETLTNCHAYWELYLSYTCYLFKTPAAKRLSKWMYEWICNKRNFPSFYKQLLDSLKIEPPPPTPSKKKQVDLLIASSPPSIIQDSPHRSPTKENQKKKKQKKVKPITKSAEQLSQEAELRKFADRERKQRKKGTFVTTTEDGAVLINVGKKVSEQAVCLHPQLADEMKPHQIEGLQFLWKQIIMVTKGVGCLLAHTMGLGKTLQIISMLITLSLLPPDAKVDMPQHLKKENRRYLVVCPAGIVTNWRNEFKRWTPRECMDALGRVSCINEGNLEERTFIIGRWYRNGGVLIIAYSQFRALLGGRNKIEEQKKILREWLLDPGPDLVVADEAHEIKNEKSQIAELLHQVKTGSRIATTGSPLSNHLEEYWAMMNWIHPGFLSNLRNFKETYIVRIKDGLYANSTPDQMRISQLRLHKLKTLLDGKIHRKDLSCIQSDLPPKTEFVMYTTLALLQRRLYEAMIKGEEWKKNHNLFKWINILRLICNHPKTLCDYITQREGERDLDSDNQQKPSTDTDSPRAEPLEVPDDETEELPPVDELHWARTIFDEIKANPEEKNKLSFTQHSNKIRIAISIVKESIKLNDNILIFVHSIPTLEFLESKLLHKGHNVFKLTGETIVKGRQDLIDEFNKRHGAVFLISSKAGSLGLNITSANRVILFDFAWNPVHDQQAVGRAYRLGQKKHVFVYRLATDGTYEETFFTENIFKLNLSKRVIDKQNPSRFGFSRNLDLRKYFFLPKPDSEPIHNQPDYNKDEFEKKDVVLDRILMYSKSKRDHPEKITKLGLTETFHKEDEETYLSAEDLLQVNKEAEEEKRLREEGKFMDQVNSIDHEVALTLFPELYHSLKIDDDVLAKVKT